MKIALSPDGPLDVAATLARYHLWGEDPTTLVGGGGVRRVLRLGADLLPYEVRWSGTVDDVRLQVTASAARGAHAHDALVTEVRQLLGLDFDLPGFYRLAKGDPVLAGLVEPLYGLRPTLASTPLEMLVGSITAQQVNLTFAFACRARLVRSYGQAVTVNGHAVYAFPTAAALGAARIRELRALKYSTRKAEYIRDLARATATGALDLDALALVPNRVVIERLVRVRGLGRWSADWFLARWAGRGDVCPAGDLAVRKAFQRYYGRGRVLAEAAIRRRARRWGSFQNLAIHYLLAGMRLVAPSTGGGA